MVIAATVLHVETLDLVKLALLHGNPFGLVLGRTLRIRSHQIVSDCTCRVADGNLGRFRGHGIGLAELVVGIEEELAGVVTSYVELVVTSLWGLEPSFGRGARTGVVVEGVLEGGEQLRLHDGDGAVISHGPVRVGVIVLRIEDILSQTWRTGLGHTVEGDSVGSASHTGDLLEGVGLDGAGDAVDGHCDVIKRVALKAPSADGHSLST